MTSTRRRTNQRYWKPPVTSRVSVPYGRLWRRGGRSYGDANDAASCVSEYDAEVVRSQIRLGLSTDEPAGKIRFGAATGKYPPLTPRRKIWHQSQYGSVRVRSPKLGGGDVVSLVSPSQGGIVATRTILELVFTSIQGSGTPTYYNSKNAPSS